MIEGYVQHNKFHGPAKIFSSVCVYEANTLLTFAKCMGPNLPTPYSSNRGSLDHRGLKQVHLPDPSSITARNRVDASEFYPYTMAFKRGMCVRAFVFCAVVEMGN